MLWYGASNRSSHRRCSVKEVFLKCSQNSQENTSVIALFLIKLQAVTAALLQKRPYVVQVFSCEFKEVLKNTCGGCFWPKLQLLLTNRYLMIHAGQKTKYNCFGFFYFVLLAIVGRHGSSSVFDPLTPDRWPLTLSLFFLLFILILGISSNFSISAILGIWTLNTLSKLRTGIVARDTVHI